MLNLPIRKIKYRTQNSKSYCWFFGTVRNQPASGKIRLIRKKQNYEEATHYVFNWVWFTANAYYITTIK